MSRSAKTTHSGLAHPRFDAHGSISQTDFGSRKFEAGPEPRCTKNSVQRSSLVVTIVIAGFGSTGGYGSGWYFCIFYPMSRTHVTTLQNPDIVQAFFGCMDAVGIVIESTANYH